MNNIYYCIGFFIFWAIAVVLLLAICGHIINIVLKIWHRTWLHDSIYAAVIYFKYIKQGRMFTVNLYQLTMLKQQIVLKRGKYYFNPWRRYFLKFVNCQIELIRYNLFKEHNEITGNRINADHCCNKCNHVRHNYIDGLGHSIYCTFHKHPAAINYFCDDFKK